jgi:hypothetical protein
MLFALAFFNTLADLATVQMIFANWIWCFPQPGIVDYAGRTTEERCSKGRYAHFGGSSISKIAVGRLLKEPKVPL